MNVMLVAGARPNFMKVAPLFHALSGRKESARKAGIDLRVSIVHTGQHYDPNMSDIFFRELGMPAPDRHLDVGSGSHAEQTAKIMVAFEKGGRPRRRADRGDPVEARDMHTLDGNPFPGENRPMTVPMERVENRILTIRGHRVMVDTDLAEVYGVPTKALNQAIKRNAERFPEDFAFRLTAEEKTELVTNCDRFALLKHSTVFPLVFTEHGAIMAASVLNSPRAIEASVYVVRAFVKMRELLATHKELVRRLDEMEGKVDRQFKVVFDAIRALMEPPTKPRRRIGY